MKRAKTSICVFIPALLFLFAQVALAQSGLGSVVKGMFDTDKRNYVYDIENYKMNVEQETDHVNVNALVRFRMTDPKKESVSFFMVQGCKISGVRDIGTGKPIDFKIKTNLFQDQIVLPMEDRQKDTHEWEFQYACYAQNISGGDITWFGPEGVYIGIIAFYPSNIMDAEFSFDLTVKTLKGFAAAANGELMAGKLGGTEWRYKGAGHMIYVFISKYHIEKRQRGDVEYQFYVNGGYEKTADYEKLMDIAEYAVKFYGKHFGSYPYKYFRMVGNPNIGEGNNWGLGDSIYIMSEFWKDNGEPTGEWAGGWVHHVIFHEIAHAWFGNRLTPDLNGVGVFVETLAATLDILATEDNTLGRDKYEFPPYWGGRNYTDMVKDLEKNKQKELPIVKVKFNLPGTEDYYYFKAPLVLRMFRYEFGDKALFDILAEFTRENAGKPCSYERFVETAGKVAGPKAVEFLKLWFEGTPRMDYALAKAEEKKTSGGYITDITIENRADTSLGKTIEALFRAKDGSKFVDDIVKVDLTEPVTSYSYKSDKKIVEIILDPHQWAVDRDIENNKLLENAILWK